MLSVVLKDVPTFWSFTIVLSKVQFTNQITKLYIKWFYLQIDYSKMTITWTLATDLSWLFWTLAGDLSWLFWTLAGVLCWLFWTLAGVFSWLFWTHAGVLVDYFEHMLEID